MPPGDRPSLLDRFRAFIAPAQPAPQPATTSTVTAIVDDSSGWQSHTHAPGDRPWGDVYADLEDTLEAWRKNFLIRRVVNVTRSYAVGSGITMSSPDPEVDRFLGEFWNHPKNRIARRLGPICDQLTRDGELFPVLFTNPVDGMSYLRFKTARQIREVRTDPDDYETELSYLENTPADPREWISPANPSAFPPANPLRRTDAASLPPLMLHWAVNKPVDATRGESDLTPVLPWALRYSEWLKDRVRLNRQRTRAGLLDVAVADDTQVEAKRQQLRRSNPVEAGIYVHGPGEEVKLHNLEINAQEAADDGEVLRLAVATGTNLALHYLGEGESTNYATAKEMGEPTARFYADRQQDIIWGLQDLVLVAYQRYCYVSGRPRPEALDLQVTVTEVARADNESLARAAFSIVQALATARQMAWIDDETALSLALKFAGETLPGEKIREILAKAQAERPPEDVETNGENAGDRGGNSVPTGETGSLAALAKILAAEADAEAAMATEALDDRAAGDTTAAVGAPLVGALREDPDAQHHTAPVAPDGTQNSPENGVSPMETEQPELIEDLATTEDLETEPAIADRDLDTTEDPALTADR